MPGLDPGIHAVSSRRVEAPVQWIAGSSPAMTRRTDRLTPHFGHNTCANLPRMTAPQQDNANVIVFPPILLLATIALAVILGWFFPIGVLAQIPFIPRIIAGAILFVLGASMPYRVRRAFTAAGTNIRPDQPTTALVTSGLFAHSRNPVYLGGSLALLGLALMLASDWLVLLMVPALLLLHYGVVLREERYLEQKFGEAYRRYMDAVPRYGWKF
jgi:protein-S-isoprenylcysteine O-methyltransferase Ste14